MSAPDERQKEERVGMPLHTQNAPAEEVGAALQIAEIALEEAQRAADALRVAHARRLLSDAFPRHAVAVFVRNWDEDRPRLVQLLSAEEGVADIDLTEDPSAPLPRGTSEAFGEAERAVRRIGDDDRLLAQVGLYGADFEHEHDGWVEFDLPLAAAETEAEAEGGDL